MSNANLTLIALLLLLTMNETLSSTQLFLLLALFSTASCACQNGRSNTQT